MINYSVKLDEIISQTVANLVGEFGDLRTTPYNKLVHGHIREMFYLEPSKSCTSETNELIKEYLHHESGDDWRQADTRQSKYPLSAFCYLDDPSYMYYVCAAVYEYLHNFWDEDGQEWGQVLASNPVTFKRCFAGLKSLSPSRQEVMQRVTVFLLLAYPFDEFDLDTPADFPLFVFPESLRPFRPCVNFSKCSEILRGVIGLNLYCKPMLWSLFTRLGAVTPVLWRSFRDQPIARSELDSSLVAFLGAEDLSWTYESVMKACGAVAILLEYSEAYSNLRDACPSSYEIIGWIAEQCAPLWKPMREAFDDFVWAWSHYCEAVEAARQFISDDAYDLFLAVRDKV